MYLWKTACSTVSTELSFPIDAISLFSSWNFTDNFKSCFRILKYEESLNYKPYDSFHAPRLATKALPELSEAYPMPMFQA